MTEQLRLRLLGGSQITLGGSVVDDFTSRKAVALLTYLAVAGGAHSRDALSGLLWGESNRSHARASLRTVLWDLRQRLPAFVTADRQTISFQPGPSCWIDVVALHEAAERALHPPGATSPDNEPTLLTEDQAGALEEAISLYRGDFMAGFFISDAPDFEDWMLRERERARQLALQALHRLLVHYKGEGAYRRAVDVARRLLTIAPWQEEIHRELMRLLVLDGQRSAALVQYETCREMLADELGVEPTLETRLLYRTIRAGRPIDQGQTTAARPAPDGQFADAHPHTATSPLLGRDDEIDALKRMLTEPGTRLVTLTGVDGVGRTSLARSVADQAAPAFERGAWFVSLGAEDGPAERTEPADPADPASRPASAPELALRVARALRLAVSARTPVSTQLWDHLGQREALLIFDDVDPSPAQLSLVVDLLRRTPYVRLLVAAAAPLGIESEHVLQLDPLPVPPAPAGDPSAWRRPDELMAYDGVRLFMERALRASPGFQLTAGNARHVAQICRLTAGLPLGIELAAAWVGRSSPAAIAQGVEARLGSATANAGGRVAGRALRAVSDYAWDHLSSAQRLALSQLVHLRYAFGQDAASQVAGVSPDGLKDLAERALLIRRISGRYDWHPALRRLALAASQAGDDLVDVDALNKRYRTHYIDALAAQAPALRGLDARTAAAAIRSDWPHVRRAWCAAVDHGEVELLERGLEGLARFLLMRGWLCEGVALMERAARALRGRCEASGDVAGQLLLRLLIEQARFLNEQSLSSAALRAARAAVEVAHSARAEATPATAWAALEAAAHREWGRALYARGVPETAAARLWQALAVLEGERAPGIRASILAELGSGELQGEELDPAREHLEQALGLYEELGDAPGRARVLGALASTAARCLDLPLATSHAQEALSLSRTLGDGRLESQARIILGRIARAQQDVAAATEHGERALRIAGQRGDPRARAGALTELALAHLHQGKKEEAWRRSLLAVELARTSGDPVVEARALQVAGHAFTELDMADQALDAYERARRLQASLGQSGQAIGSLAGLARANLVKGNLAKAQAIVEEVLARLEEGDGIAVDEPMRVYLACYQVLGANDDPRAQDVLTTASGLYAQTT